MSSFTSKMDNNVQNDCRDQQTVQDYVPISNMFNHAGVSMNLTLKQVGVQKSDGSWVHVVIPGIIETSSDPPSVQDNSSPTSSNATSPFFNSGPCLTVKLKETKALRSDGSKVYVAVVIPDIIKDTSSTLASDVQVLPHASNVVKAKTVKPTTLRLPTFACFNCKKTFDSRSSLKRHEPIHIGTYLCKFLGCGSTYRNLTTLTKHYVDEHGLILPHSTATAGPMLPRTSRVGTIVLTSSPTDEGNHVEDSQILNGLIHDHIPYLCKTSFGLDQAYDGFPEEDNMPTSTSTQLLPSATPPIEATQLPEEFLDMEMEMAFFREEFDREEFYENFLRNVKRIEVGDEFP